MAYVFQTLPAQRSLIDPADPREVIWWNNRFGYSEEQLRQAVATVRNTAAQVEQFLDGKGIVIV